MKMKLFKKISNKLKSRLIIRKSDYPKNLKFYGDKFILNGWEVTRNKSYSSDEVLIVAYDGTKVAKVYAHETIQGSSHIKEIKILDGYEELHALIIQVLHAAAQERVRMFEQIENKKKELVKKAQNETKWLGPF